MQKRLTVISPASLSSRTLKHYCIPREKLSLGLMQWGGQGETQGPFDIHFHLLLYVKLPCKFSLKKLLTQLK